MNEQVSKQNSVDIVKWINQNIPYEEKGKLFKLVLGICCVYHHILSDVGMRDSDLDKFLEFFTKDEVDQISINSMVFGVLLNDILEEKSWEECCLFREFADILPDGLNFGPSPGDP